MNFNKTETLSTLSNTEVLAQAQSLVAEERRITTQVLKLLREIERRQIFAELGFSSLHEFSVKYLKYSEGAAYRRISAMRLLREIPELESKIEAGRLSPKNSSSVPLHRLSSLRQALWQRLGRQCLGE